VTDRTRIHTLKAHVAALTALALCGCGSPYDASVTGLATLDSAPLERGVVTFAPTSGGAAAYGQIGADGRYEIWTGREAGLKPGQYVVSVVSTEDTGDRGKDGGPPPLGKSITPDWYRDSNTSGLNFTIEPGDNEINLELSSTPPSGWIPPRGTR
jgi:hypothetical protein